jgi:signal transduction histidine kinase
MATGAIDILVRFSRMASEANSGREILPLLADAAVEHVKADAAVVVEVASTTIGTRRAGTLRATAARGVPGELAAWEGEDDVIDDEVGQELVRKSQGQFTRASTIPLVSDGGLFGAIVLLFGEGRPVDEMRMQVARGLADLAAVALGRAAEHEKLARTNAELRASRETLARTEKLRALGQMAAGVSHDLKNILNPLSLNVQLAQRALAKGNTDQANGCLDECRNVIRRGVETIDRLREFSRQSPEKRATQADLNVLMNEAVALARPRLSSRGGTPPRIVVEPGTVPPVVVHTEEVLNAIVNLVVNAIDAMTEAGTITLRTALVDGRVTLTVADTGPGMSPEVQARVFEPFFTTKGADGTGLGLAMVFATMQRHLGSVTLESTPGQGAAFTLLFPVSALAVPAPE